MIPPLPGTEADTPAAPPSIDVLIVGTGLLESVLAAALAWSGTTVLHVDLRPVYGSSLALLLPRELVAWNAQNPAGFSDVLLYIPRTVDHASVDLTPRIVFCRLDLIDLLVKSRVHQYLEFQLLSSFHTFENDQFEKLALLKQDIFTDQLLLLPTKRGLMRFFKFVLASDEPENAKVWQAAPSAPALLELFGIPAQQAVELICSLGLVSSLLTPVRDVLLRVRRYLLLFDVYGGFPALTSKYGGPLEVVQGFCRLAAVAGAVYRLNTTVKEYHDGVVTFGDGSTCRVEEKVVVGLGELWPGRPAVKGSAPPVTHLTTIVDNPCAPWFGAEALAIITFPPKSLPTGNEYAVQGLVQLSDAGAVEKGQSVWYLLTQGNLSDLEAAAERMEQAVLRESEDEFDVVVGDGDVAQTPSGVVVLLVRVGEAFRNYIPKGKVSALLRLSYVRECGSGEGVVASNANVLFVAPPSGDLLYDGVVGEARRLYAAVTGSDDDFFDVDFEDDEGEVGETGPTADPGFADEMEL